MKEIVNDGFAKVVKPYMDAQDKKSREIIAPVEVSPAEAAHSIGDQIIFDGILYDVIAPIAVDDPLTATGAGANIEPADDISAQIKAQKAEIQTVRAQAAANNKSTQEMIAPVEEDETDASRAYEIGEQLILDGILYDVIDDIAQHGIITAEGAGANIEAAGSVTEQIASQNQALTNEVVTRGSLGAKNLYPSANFTILTNEGLTYTLQPDGSIIVNGTALSTTYFVSPFKTITLPKGKYILSGCPDVNGDEFKTRIYIPSLSVHDYGSGVTFTLNSDTSFNLAIRTENGKTLDNVVFKPMIRLATDSDPTYQPYSMTNRELTPIAQAVSNRNLLDNPWFTVNQRGTTAFTRGNYPADRWCAVRVSGETSNNGVSFAFDESSSTFGYLWQRIEDYSMLAGKTVTFSVLVDGELHTLTGTFPVKGGSLIGRSFNIGNDTMGMTIEHTSEMDYAWVTVRNFSTNNHTVRAVKLELGSVSTLHMDTAPNYATELLKCQRYFQVIAQGSRWRLDQYSGGGMVNISLPVQMRDKPTLSNTSFYLRSLDLATETAVSSASINPEHNYNELLIILGASTWNQDGQAYLKDGDLWLSADL